MKNCKFIIGLALFLVLICGNALAVRVNSLYQARLQVADHSDMTRQQALADGLQQVLIKVSGNAAIATLPVIQKSLVSASDYVQSYSYDDQYLNIKFDRSSVLQILSGAHQAVLGENRPLILTWIAKSDDGDVYNFVADGSDDAKLLQQAADIRGLPLLLPILDMQDLTAISMPDFTGLKQQAIMAAAKRYKVQTILSGTINKMVDGSYQSNWLFLVGGDAINWQFNAASEDAVITQLLDKVSGEISTRYAILNDSKLNKELTLVVTGISGLGDYADVIKYLQGLNAVRKVELIAIAPGKLKLNVVCDGGQDGLKKAIALDAKLLPTVQPDKSSNVDMAMQWVKQ